MTTARAVGAVSREAAEWYAIDWQATNRNVRRLQVRIVQATKASRWGKVRALQRLLTHSYSGKVLAVRRVTENQGKKTPGVDQEIWDTPEGTVHTWRPATNFGAQLPTRAGAALQKRRVSNVKIRAARGDIVSGCRRASGAKGSIESWEH
jgi:hypothetical protein